MTASNNSWTPLFFNAEPTNTGVNVRCMQVLRTAACNKDKCQKLCTCCIGWSWMDGRTARPKCIASSTYWYITSMKAIDYVISFCPYSSHNKKVKTTDSNLTATNMPLILENKTTAQIQRWCVSSPSKLTRISSSVGVFSSRNISPSISSTFETHSVHKQAQHYD